MVRSTLIVFQRHHQDGILAKLRYAKSVGIKTIYELDDDLFQTPEGFVEPYKFYSDPKVRAGLIAFLSEADAITVSTMNLAKAIKKYANGRPIFVVENAIDMGEWQTAYEEKQATPPSETVTIGWMASGSHTIDIPVVSEALETIMAKHPQVRLHFIGWVGFENVGTWAPKYKDRITSHGWIDNSVLPYAMRDFDVGIAPVVDNQFNQSKSNIKALQYWTLGIPCVASPLQPYAETIEHGVDGFLPANNGSTEWCAALEVLVTEAHFRKQMGKMGRKKVAEKYDMRHNVKNWVGVFDRIVESR
jgi:glycosyltransferase involved in cell wall biosynthesis